MPLLVTPARQRPASHATERSERSERSERELAEFWAAYVDSGDRGVGYIARHPVRSVRMLRDILRLPVLHARPASSPGGAAVLGTLSMRGPLGSPARWLGWAVLVVPADPEEYLAGRRAQTIRRKIRSAEREGVRCEPVTDLAERRSLLALANAVEREHPDPQYRVTEPDNDDLLQHDLWMKAVAADGEPLLLAVTPVDGEFATLRYFRTLGGGPEHSDSRYLATSCLVGELAARGVRYLLDTEASGGQTNGLRHFQRMVGFRYHRVRLRRRG